MWTKFTVGECVRVKAGTKDPDFEGEIIGGWQGRVVEIEQWKGEQLLTVQWDSLTLKAMKESYILQCEKDGLEYFEMSLMAKVFEKADVRDKPKDVESIQDFLYKKYYWAGLEEQGIRIQKIIGGVKGEIKQFQTWEDHLFQELSFPFEAKIAESNRIFANQRGKKVEVTGFDVIDDLRGIVVNLGGRKGPFQYPLSDLAVLDRTSPNYQAVDDYAVWFANR